MWFGSALLMTEATSPFNNTHWMLSKIGFEEKKITKIIGYLFALNWIVFRIIIPDFIVYRLFIKWDDFIAMNITPKLILGTNMLFLTLMNHIYFVTGPFYELVFGKPKKKES